MTVHVNIILEDQPAGGVTLRAYGPIRSDGSDAAFVARALLRLAVPLFAAGKPVRLVGQAEAIGTDASDLTMQEVDTLRCQACGKGLLA